MFKPEKIKYKLRFLKGIKFDFRLNPGQIVGRAFMVLVAVALAYNVYLAYQRSVENRLRIIEEEQKLEALMEEQRELKDQEKYYSSIEYRRGYARDSLNLAEPGTKLYMVQRTDQIEAEDLTDQGKPISLQNNAYWWKTLILGQ